MLTLWGTSVLLSQWALVFLWSQLLHPEDTLMHVGTSVLLLLHPEDTLMHVGTSVLLHVGTSAPFHFTSLLLVLGMAMPAGHLHPCQSVLLPHTGNCQPRQRKW